MDKLLIEGGHALRGEVAISGAKNAALPLLAASLLSKDTIVLNNVPHLADIHTMGKLLQYMGVGFTLQNNQARCCAANTREFIAPYELVKTMRASILVLGPLLARYGESKVSLPGGCAIGQRPVDQHVRGLQALGAEIEVDHGFIYARCKRLKGTTITSDMITVTGTENLMMAACLAEGSTVIHNAAQEPEVVDLAQLLIKMGARISGAGSSTIRIEGVKQLHAAEHTVIADRIEAGTFACAAVATLGSVTITGCEPLHLEALLPKLQEAGATLNSGEDFVTITCSQRPIAVSIRTSEYPGFATDMQAQFMAINCIAAGTAQITETIFENRFMHVQELLRLGADITIHGNTCTVKGVDRLLGAQVMATDLRASASLVIGGLVAHGETTLHRIYHLDRGYEMMEQKLQLLGARIQRIA